MTAVSRAPDRACVEGRIGDPDAATDLDQAVRGQRSGQVQTLFRGETLRGLLLNAYAFWKFGQLALIGAIAMWALAGIMLVLSFLGFWHLRRVPPAERVFAPAERMPEGVSA
jgi:hypothetical protein